MTTTIHHLLEPGRRMLLGLAFVAVVAACGPGTGGTGTGPEASVQVQTFTSAPGAAPTPASTPADPVAGSCDTACTGISLRLEPARLALAAPCLQFVFDGAWQADAAGVVLLDGVLQRGAPADSEAARLRLQFPDLPARSAEVTLVLTDRQGQALLGPVSLRQEASVAGPAAGVCALR